MSRKQNVDWDATNNQVLLATLELYKDRNYVPSKAVARHIKNKRNNFSQFQGLTNPSILFRTTKAMKKMNWKIWGSSGKRGTVFIPPWAEKP